MKELYYEIGQRVYEIRQENKLTQSKMAEKMDISVKHCSSVERGVSTFSLEKLVHFCDTFDVSLDYLVRGKDEEEQEPLPEIPGTVIEIMSSDDEDKKLLFIEYIKWATFRRKGLYTNYLVRQPRYHKSVLFYLI